MHKKGKSNYAVIVFFNGEETPKKWSYVNKLNGFALFLEKKHTNWSYMNVYDRKTRVFLKRFNRGNFIPAFL